MNTATSNISCPTSPTACRFPARERGHEQHHGRDAIPCARPAVDRCGGVISHAATEADYKAACAAAEAASKKAAGLHNQWTTTISTLAAAKNAGDSGDFDRAIAAAKEAEALAKASIFQATSEKEAWKTMEIR
jgi:hypothetical protein